MKKALLFCLTIAICVQLQAQHFDDYFINKTLRIDYLHSGGAVSDEYEIKNFHAGGIWSGTRAHLIDPYIYGNIIFQVYDSLTNKLIYSRTYSSLYEEYKATEKAEREIASFEECVNMPFPKRTVKVSFTSVSRRQEQTLRLESYINPATASIKNFKKEYEVIDLHIGGNSEECLDILFILDGYAQKDKALLEQDMQRFASYVMECSPYKENKEKVNIRAIKGYSKESGITDPNAKVFKNTLLNTSYNVLDLDRYLMCLNVWKMYDIADDAACDAIVIICNSPKYGGGGIYNFYATVNNLHEKSSYVVVHELGHSIGGLGDEYYTSEVSVRDFYPEGIEPAEPNLTTLVDFEAKWKDMMDKDTPVPTPNTEQYKNTLGVFEGGGYVAEGVYRPVASCTMKEAVYNHFCPVCTKTLINLINYYSNK